MQVQNSIIHPTLVDGSSGHLLYKQLTRKSLLDGACMVSSTIPLQMITSVNNKVKVIHDNALCRASDSPRPVRYWFVRENWGKWIKIGVKK